MRPYAEPEKIFIAIHQRHRTVKGPSGLVFVNVSIEGRFNGSRADDFGKLRNRMVPHVKFGVLWRLIMADWCGIPGVIDVLHPVISDLASKHGPRELGKAIAAGISGSKIFALTCGRRCPMLKIAGQLELQLLVARFRARSAISLVMAGWLSGSWEGRKPANAMAA